MEFFYTPEMHTILNITSTATTAVINFLTLSLALMLNGEKVTLKRKLLFVLLFTIVQQSQIYIAYFAGVMGELNPQQQMLLIVPNPLTALFFYFLMVKIFGLSKYRLLNVSNETYLYGIAMFILADLVANTFFAQPGGSYNYMLDSLGCLNALALNLIAFFVIRHLLQQNNYITRINHTVSATHFRRNLFLSILGYFAIYAFAAIVPAIEVSLLTDILRVLVVFLILALYIALLLWRSQRTIVRNQSVYIYSLSRANDNFRELKHDFNNILHGYSGYIDLGNMEKLENYHHQVVNESRTVSASLHLAQRLEEFPALVSILMSKLNTAAEMGVDLQFGISGVLESGDMSELDACRCISSLLDNALTAAASTDKKVRFTYQVKTSGNKLFIISNSVPKPSLSKDASPTRDARAGMSFKTVYKIIGKYPNCTFNMSSYENEFVVYLELQPRIP